MIDELRAQLAAAQEENNHRSTAINAYKKYTEGDEEGEPIERLRFFLSLAPKGQDWIDVEKFIDDVSDQLAKAEQRVAEWQPINTAPKDEWILTYPAIAETKWIERFVIENRPTYESGWYRGSDTMPIFPTHWMPLPKAPNTASS